MVNSVKPVRNMPAVAAAEPRRAGGGGESFEAVLRQRTEQKPAAQSVNFSKHAMARAEERGIELTPDLMDQLASSVEKAKEKGVSNILAMNDSQAFIINVPYGRVITTMTQAEMRNNIFTNIDGTVLL